MKVSLITTVKNEADNIEEFLISVVKQSKKPDEFIIVDGGSLDKTTEIIQKHAKKHKWIKLFVAPKASVGRGRNIAIKKAKNEIIAATDAGCILDKNWLKNILRPFQKENVDVVTGIYKPYYTNNFEYFQGLVVIPKAEKINTPSRMSSRSLAFKRYVWENVDGYPDMSTGEDTAFNLKLISNNFKFEFVRDAIVYWRMRKTWKDFAKQFYRYGSGDRRLGLLFKMKLNLLMVLGFYFLLAILGLSLILNRVVFSLTLALTIIYFLSYGIKFYRKTKKISSIYYGFFLVLVKRVAYITGLSIDK